MSFSDDDLKRLKVHLKSAEQATDYAVPQVSLPCGVIKALLARLEAAEKVIMHSELFCEAGCKCPSRIAWEAWRKAAGK